ncbi:hypothetical protein D3C84_970330 [compost metagenome]
MGRDVQALAQQQPQGRFGAALQRATGQLVEVEKGQPPLWIVQYLGAHPRFGEQQAARHIEFLDQIQQGRDIGHRDQFASELEQGFHLVLIG